MSDNVTFHGSGPFDLPVAQLVSADRTGNTIVLTFQVLVDPSHLEAVRIAVPENLAPALLDQIARATSKDE